LRVNCWKFDAEFGGFFMHIS